jgi:hypothetical protein
MFYVLRNLHSVMKNSQELVIAKNWIDFGCSCKPGFRPCWIRYILNVDGRQFGCLQRKTRVQTHISNLDFAVISLVAAMEVIAGSGNGERVSGRHRRRSTSGSSGGPGWHERITWSITEGAVVAVLAL